MNMIYQKKTAKSVQTFHIRISHQKFDHKNNQRFWKISLSIEKIIKLPFFLIYYSPLPAGKRLLPLFFLSHHFFQQITQEIS